MTSSVVNKKELSKPESLPGYKNTVLGWIPEDWTVENVGNAFSICNNLRYPISEEERKKIPGQYPYYGPTKIQDYINEFRIDGKYVLIGEDGDHFLKWRELPMTLIAQGKFNVNNHAHLLQGSERNITEWFLYFFQHRELTPFLTRQGAGRYKLTKDSLVRMPVALPPLPEQIAIAKLLSTWDEAISKLQALIDAKTTRKKWLMQQLLTGKKRLPGFEGAWEKVTLGQLLTESRIPGGKSDPSKKITVRLHLKGVEARENNPNEAVDATAYYRRKSGQFIYGKQNLHKGAIGIVPQELDGYESSQDIPCFDFVEDLIHPRFLLYLFSREAFYTKLESISTGTGSKRIQPEQLFKVEIKIPEKSEQAAIAEFLFAADKEIELNNSKLENLKEQKKGLMQQLLTGKKRLKH